MPLSPPPRDDAGDVLPHDHPEIKNGDGIIRRISEQFVVQDTNGNLRISSMAFSPSSGPHAGMSVDLEKEIKSAGLDPRAYVTDLKWIGSVRFQAGALRALQLKVGFSPVNRNPYHGEVWHIRTRSQKREVQKLAAWFVAIPDVSL